LGEWCLGLVEVIFWYGVSVSKELTLARLSVPQIKGQGFRELIIGITGPVLRKRSKRNMGCELEMRSARNYEWEWEGHISFSVEFGVFSEGFLPYSREDVVDLRYC